MKIVVTLLILTLGAVGSALAQNKELPEFFPAGVVQTADPLRQEEEVLRLYASARNCASNKIIPGSDSVRITFDGKNGRDKVVSTSSVTQDPAYLTIVLDNYVRIGNKVRVTPLCGNKEPYFITKHQLDVDISYLEKAIKEAAQIRYDYYKSIPDMAAKAFTQVGGIPYAEFRKSLDQKYPGTDVTYREYNHLLPEQKLSDFIPREFHLGYTPDISDALAVTWLNTGVVYCRPVAIIRDYIMMGKPIILEHEFTHVNKWLQHFPLTEGFDAELWASIPDMIDPADEVDFIRHSYLKTLRELGWVFGGYDYKTVRKQVVEVNLGGNLVINESKYREYFVLQQKVKKMIADAFPKVLAEYYTNQLYWQSMAERLGDKDAVLKIMMADNFDPTILGGHDKSATYATAHKEQVMEWAEESFKETAEDENQGSVSEADFPESFIQTYYRLFNEQQRLVLEKKCEKDQKACRNLLQDPSQIILFFQQALEDIPGGKKGGGQ